MSRPDEPGKISGTVGAFVAVEGPTGVGKTTLVRRLYRLLDAQPFFDPFEENPFLPRLYSANQQEAANLAVLTELGFLALRVAQLRKIRAHMAAGKTLLADWSMTRQQVFAAATLDEADRHRVARTCAVWTDDLPVPDLVVHLRADATTLLSRIAQRGRAMESRVTLVELAGLSAAYSTALSTSRQSVLPVDFTSFDVFSDTAVATLAAQIQSVLTESRRNSHVPNRAGNPTPGHQRGSDVPAVDVHRPASGGVDRRAAASPGAG